MSDERPRQTYGEMMAEKEAEREKKERQWEERRRRLLKSHAITGGITYLILALLINFPYSFLPLNLLSIVLTSVLVGMPVGFVISWLRGGLFLGGLISSFAFVLITFLSQVISGSEMSVLELRGFIFSAIFGAIPGIFIGWHVEQDQ